MGQGKYEYLHLTGPARKAAVAYIDAVAAFYRKRAAFVRGLGAEDQFLTYRDGPVVGVKFKSKPKGKGWKESRRNTGFWVPDRRYKEGKELSEQFNNFRKPGPSAVTRMVEPAGFDSGNLQPLHPNPSGNGCLMVNAFVAKVKDNYYLVMPHRDFNEPDGTRGRKRKKPAPLPEGFTLVKEWEYLKAVDEAEQADAADAKTSRKSGPKKGSRKKAS